MLLALLVALGVAALLAACSQSGPQRFPHEKHLASLDCGKPGTPACLDCNTCHTPTQPGREGKLPDVTLCETCHTDDKQGLLSVLNVRPERLAGAITFNHSQHLALDGVEGQCVGCHGGVVREDEPRIPTMSECMDCHEHQTEFDSGQCAPCHADTKYKRVLPQTFLRHEGSFKRRHGQAALSSEKLCQSCHAQVDCDSCHDASQVLGIERRRPEALLANQPHRGDFITRHAIEAQANAAMCQRCHEPSSCDSCHLARGVSAGRAGSLNPHPVGWVTNSAADQSLHGREARRDLMLCASCHDQGPATNCIRCHTVGGYGGNPHPRGWRSSRTPNAAMCRYCHE